MHFGFRLRSAFTTIHKYVRRVYGGQRYISKQTIKLYWSVLSKVISMVFYAKREIKKKNI